MSTPTYAYTPEFTIILDRAGHLVAEKLNPEGQIIAAYDFGHTNPVVPVLLSWLEMDRREELAPAIDALLREQFAKIGH